LINTVARIYANPFVQQEIKRENIIPRDESGILAGERGREMKLLNAMVALDPSLHFGAGK
jgi:hypothetical protein